MAFALVSGRSYLELERISMENKYQQLYDKVLSDSAFRNQLASDSKAALRIIGIDEPSAELLKAIDSIKDDVTKLEKIFGEVHRFAP